MPRFGTTPQGWQRMMETLTGYLSNLGLTKERMKGYRGLERLEHTNLMDRMKQSWMYQISRDPELSRLRSQFFINQDPRIGEQIRSRIQQRADLAKGALRGQLTPQMEQTLGGLVDETYRFVLGEAGVTGRQARQIEEVEVPKLGIRGYEAETGRREAITGAGRLAFDITKFKQKPQEEQIKAWRAIVKDTIDFLEAEGVKGSDLSTEGRALFSSAKVLDPLRADLRGKAFTYLMEIQIKLAKGQLPSPGEEIFLTKVRNTAQIMKPPEAGGGLPTPTTGITPYEEKERMIQEIMDDMRGRTGITDERQLRQLAEEFYASLIK